MTGTLGRAASRTTPARDNRTAKAPPSVFIAVGVLAVLVLAALIPDALAPYDPLQADPAAALRPPSWSHPFGTDQLGRDVLSRVIGGARYSLSLGFGASALSLIGGIAAGVAAGSLRGAAAQAATRALDVLMAFPEVLLALITIAIAGPGQLSVILAVGIGGIPGSARLVRSQVLRVRQEPFVRAARELGLSRFEVLWRHIALNSLGPALVAGVLHVGTAIIFGAALSFLGLGAVPPAPEWGLMLSQARQYLSLAPWAGIWPGLFITVTVIAVTVTGRWLQQRFVNKRSAL
ncbi:MAG: ABC transporter permease [Bifidobacteriaceae bacterium]|jgi:peptide/nickel transport system permease protein|nr:ABC transporter permease [Bifidobacteriaceae bacterium]